jgi:hypothetical protein
VARHIGLHARRRVRVRVRRVPVRVHEMMHGMVTCARARLVQLLISWYIRKAIAMICIRPTDYAVTRSEAQSLMINVTTHLSSLAVLFSEQKIARADTCRKNQYDDGPHSPRSIIHTSLTGIARKAGPSACLRWADTN